MERFGANAAVSAASGRLGQPCFRGFTGHFRLSKSHRAKRLAAENGEETQETLQFHH